MVATFAACQSLLQGLIEEITRKTQRVVTVFMNNKSTIALMKTMFLMEETSTLTQSVII